MKPSKDAVKSFKEQYRTLIEFERQIKKHIRNLKKSARELYMNGDKNGCSEVKSLFKCYDHLESLCWGEIDC